MRVLRNESRARTRPLPGVVVGTLLALVAILLPGTPAGAAAGDIDPGFGTAGFARVNFPEPPSVDGANAIGRRDGDFFAVGSANDRFAIGNFTRQTDFGGQEGQILVDFGQPAAANAVYEQSDHPVVAGRAGDDFALAGFIRRDINFDFGNGGRVTTSFGAPAEALGIVRGGAGSDVLAVGTVRPPGGVQVAMARYDNQGALNPTFGTGGTLTDDIGPGDDVVRAVKGINAFTFLVAGRSGTDVLVARYGVDGTRDPAFGEGGARFLTLPAGPAVAEAVDVDESGRVLLAGSAGSSGFVARLSPNGQPDPTFGDGGIVVTDGALRGVSALLDGGRVMAAGTLRGPNGPDGVVLSLGPDGRPDPAFGGNGTVVVDLGGTDDQLTAVEDGYVVGGNGADMVGFLIRPDGSLWTPDSAKGPLFTVDFGKPMSTVASGVVAQPDGKIVVAGSGGRGIFVMRFLPNGRLDPMFGRGGISRLHFHELAGPIALQPDGRIVVPAGTVVLGFLPNGGLDLTYGHRGIAYPGTRVGPEGGGIDVMSDGGVVVAGGLDVGRLTASGARVYGGDSSWDGPAYADVIALPDGRALTLSWGDPYASPYASLRRYNPDGSVDQGFLEGSSLTGAAVVRLSDGRFLAGGTDGPRRNPGPGDLLLARFTAGGLSEDNGSNVTRLDVTAEDRMVDLLRQPDDRVVAVFRGSPYGAPPLAGLARFLPDGRPDRSFGVNGTRTFPGLNPTAAAVMPDRSVAILGNTGNGIALVKFLPGSAGNRPAHAWGGNGTGQLGTGATSAAPRPAPTPIAPRGVTATAAGALHSLTVKGDGTVWAWGSNATGQLGDGSTRDSPHPRPVPGLSGVTSVAAGANHSLALKSDGTVWAWGWNGNGQLGIGSTVDSRVPVRVLGVGKVVAVSAGTLHTLALRVDGAVFGWGANGSNQLGNWTGTDSRVAVQACCIGPATSIAAGGYHSLAVVDGWAYTWGWNYFGQLGHAPLGELLAPSRAEGPRGVVAVAGGYLHSLALTSDGKVWTWGFDGYGQLGSDETTGGPRTGPVPGLTKVMSISAGLYHSVALTGDGGIRSWGWNGLGQLGNGSTADAHTPVTAGAPAAVGVAAGWLHTLSF